MTKQQYIVEMELPLTEAGEIKEFGRNLEVFNLQLVGIAEETGPKNGDNLFFIKGTERMIIEMYRTFGECSDEEILEIMEYAYAIN